MRRTHSLVRLVIGVAALLVSRFGHIVNAYAAVAGRL
jgi:hypothetical protein